MRLLSRSALQSSPSGLTELICVGPHEIFVEPYRVAIRDEETVGEGGNRAQLVAQEEIEVLRLARPRSGGSSGQKISNKTSRETL